MGKLNNLAKMVKNAEANTIADNFVNDLIYSIEQDNISNYTPTRAYKPSGISGCERALFYELSGAEQDKKVDSPELIGICESGTSRHEIIQDYIMNMKSNNIDCEWLDVGQYLKDNNITDPQILHQKGNETKLFSKKYNMRFMCDGLIKYNGELYILEIKTESTHKFFRHDVAYEDHIQQATCYAMNLQVNKVIFLYENRDCCTKKAYLVEVTEAMIKRVEDIINSTNKAVKENILPYRCVNTKKCTYCKYKTQCKKDGV